MVELFDDELVQKLADSRRELLAEYRQPHEHPWIIGYSGGKHSTLVVHLVMEMLMALPRSERVRQVHIVANDTLVESPLVVGHIKATMARFDEAAAALRLPVVTQITAPKLDHGFWVNLIGRGYPAPSRSFRWCTDRMKIQPTSDYDAVIGPGPPPIAKDRAKFVTAEAVHIPHGKSAQIDSRHLVEDVS